jgi:hypothetical protein
MEATTTRNGDAKPALAEAMEQERRDRLAARDEFARLYADFLNASADYHREGKTDEESERAMTRYNACVWEMIKAEAGAPFRSTRR